jgi:hypothetical protein
LFFVDPRQPFGLWGDLQMKQFACSKPRASSLEGRHTRPVTPNPCGPGALPDG